MKLNPDGTEVSASYHLGVYSQLKIKNNIFFTQSTLLQVGIQVFWPL